MTTKIIVELETCPSCGELWPFCRCGQHSTPPGTVTDGGDEPEPEPWLVEWVQWKTKSGGLSLFHVRVTSGGWLLCGRKIPPDSAPAADSLTAGPKCRVCERKLAS